MVSSRPTIKTVNHRDDLCWTSLVRWPDGRVWESTPTVTRWGAWLQARYHVARERRNGAGDDHD